MTDHPFVDEIRNRISCPSAHVLNFFQYIVVMLYSKTSVLSFVIIQVAGDLVECKLDPNHGRPLGKKKD
jgi:hypothetical protein